MVLGAAIEELDDEEEETMPLGATRTTALLLAACEVLAGGCTEDDDTEVRVMVLVRASVEVVVPLVVSSAATRGAPAARTVRRMLEMCILAVGWFFSFSFFRFCDRVGVKRAGTRVRWMGGWIYGFIWRRLSARGSGKEWNAARGKLGVVRAYTSGRGGRGVEGEGGGDSGLGRGAPSFFNGTGR